jgi:hypothetical protein
MVQGEPRQEEVAGTGGDMTTLLKDQIVLVMRCAEEIADAADGSFRDLMMMNDLISCLLIHRVCPDETTVQRVADIHAYHIKNTAIEFFEEANKETLQ